MFNFNAKLIEVGVRARSRDHTKIAHHHQVKAKIFMLRQAP
jgi:hypothetical protein